MYEHVIAGVNPHVRQNNFGTSAFNTWLRYDDNEPRFATFLGAYYSDSLVPTLVFSSDPGAAVLDEIDAYYEAMQPPFPEEASEEDIALREIASGANYVPTVTVEG